MSTPRILAFAGSTRTGSYNAKLAGIAASSASNAGAEVSLIDLKDYPMPLYNGDLEAEQGVPEAARALKAVLGAHDGLIIVSPEYNGFITPLLKNTLDWLSRPDQGVDGLTLFRDKLAVVLSASPGALGGLRSLMLARQLLTNLGVTVLPDQLAVAKAAEAFTATGQLVDARQQATVDRICARLVSTLSRLKAGD